MADDCIDKPSTCEVIKEGDPPFCSEHASKCRVTAKLTGGYLKPANGDPLCLDAVGFACVPQEPKQEVVEKPCAFTTDPAGLVTCGSSIVGNKEGTTKCGVANGEYVCSNNPPEHNGVNIFKKIETDTTSLPGKTKRTETDHLVQTYCAKPQKSSCVITNTTTTKTTITNTSDGKTESTTGTCSGAACPDKNGNPDANGDGFGDCLKDCGEGEDSEGTAGVSDDCKVPPPCDGDPFQCAILQQSALNSCLERALPTDAEKLEIKNLTDAAYAANEESQGVLDSKVNGLLNGLKSAGSGNSSHGSGVCLPDYPISFMRTTFVMEFSKLCPILAMFRFGLLFIAYLGAARIVSTQL